MENLDGYYHISYWDISRNRICNELIDYNPLWWQKKNLGNCNLIAWNEISKAEYFKYIDYI